jgi:hypothetical protein
LPFHWRAQAFAATASGGETGAGSLKEFNVVKDRERS